MVDKLGRDLPSAGSFFHSMFEPHNALERLMMN